MRATGIRKAFLLVLGLVSALALSACDKSEVTVLLIFSYHAEYTWHAEEARGVEEVLLREGISFETFYLDTKRHTTHEWEEEIAAEVLL